MFKPKFAKKDDRLQDEINVAILQLGSLDVYDEKYTTAVENIEKLEMIHQNRKKNYPSSDALLAAGTNLFGILLILNHERIGVISSKAFNLLPKTRI